MSNCATAAAPNSSSQREAELLIAAAQNERDRQGQFAELFWTFYQRIAIDQIDSDSTQTLESLSKAVTLSERAWEGYE